MLEAAYELSKNGQNISLFLRPREFEVMFQILFIKCFLGEQGISVFQDEEFKQLYDTYDKSEKDQLFKQFVTSYFGEEAIVELRQQQQRYQGKIWDLVPNLMIKLLGFQLHDFLNQRMIPKEELKETMIKLSLLDVLFQKNLY